MKRNTAVLLIFIVTLAIVLIITIINKTNSTPTANSDTITTKEDTPVSITLTGSDSDGNPLTYKIVTAPTHGSLSGTEPNITYIPGRNFNGSDSFSFKVNDGTSDSTTATISITVTSVNDPPLANDDNATILEDAPAATINVLANDTDMENDRLTVLSATQGKNGSVTINTDNTLSYVPNENFSGTDNFTYTAADDKGAKNTARVNIEVKPINDAPRIISKPQTTTRVWASYSYQVKAKDPDLEDKLTYSLNEKPEGMTIEQASGLIEWKPTGAQAGTYDVTVKVEDSNSVPVSDTQSFTLTVTSLSSPLTTTLNIKDGYCQKSMKKLSQEDKVVLVRDSDNKCSEIERGSFISYDFSDPDIPKGANISSIVIYVEHFEQGSFPPEKLQWRAGTGWPGNPAVWASTNAPVRTGKQNQATDSWDITSSIDTHDKINSLQLQIQNNNSVDGRNVMVDCIYAIVKWY
jgi:hypothetical protein